MHITQPRTRAGSLMDFWLKTTNLSPSLIVHPSYVLLDVLKGLPTDSAYRWDPRPEGYPQPLATLCGVPTPLPPTPHT